LLYAKLTQKNGYNYEHVSNWMRKIDFTQYDELLLPVFVSGNHFVLIHIDLLSSTINYLDSMIDRSGSYERAKIIVENVRQLLQDANIANDCKYGIWNEVFPPKIL
jgi:Ulp1 family protease